MTGYPDPTREKLLDAALTHVIFDGWGPETFAAALADSGLNPALAEIAAPRGATDLASAYHKRGDRALEEALSAADLSGLRYSEKVAHAIWLRLTVVDREIVRRGMSLFALPHLAPEGARLVWETADAIWCALGDMSDDLNWYSKRATLSAVFGSTVLFWLGDESDGYENTQAFIERRIGNVMQFEKTKAAVSQRLPQTGPLAHLAGSLFNVIKAPAGARHSQMPGRKS